MKKKVTLILAVVMLISLVLVGCQQPQSPTTNAPTDAPTDAPTEVTTIKLFHRWTVEPAKTVVEEMIADFQRDNPDIKVDVQTATNDAYKEKIKTVIASNDAPDVYFTWAGEYLNKFVREGLAYDLTDMLKESGTYDKMVEGQINAFSYNDRIYGVPIKLDAKVFYYNKQIFADLGIEPPKTYTEFITMLEKIKAAGITPIYHGNVSPWAGAHYITTLNQKMVPEDVRAKDYNPATGEFTDPGYIRALEIYDELHEYMNSDVTAYDWGYTYSGFLNGDCALYYDQYITIPDFVNDAPDFIDNIGMFPFPAIEEGKGNQMLITGAPDGYAIHAKTKNLEAAYRFIEYTLSDEVVAKFAKELYWVNAQKSVIDNIEQITTVTPLIEGMEYIKNSEGNVNWFDADVHAKIAQVYLENLQRLDNKEITPEEIMVLVQEAATQLRKEFN
jgi:raffinose/stachyose/melibiose transport system substrate-binding protein